MKQTKPYGRAFIPTAELAAEKPDTEQPAVKQSEQEAAVPAANSNSDAADQGTGALPGAVPVVSVPWHQSILEYGVVAFALAVLLTVYVLVRDNTVLASRLQQLTTEETVMVCKEGKMVYPDYSILDRLMNKGRFVCTEWSVQRGFLTPPRR